MSRKSPRSDILPLLGSGSCSGSAVVGSCPSYYPSYCPSCLLPSVAAGCLAAAAACPACCPCCCPACCCPCCCPCCLHGSSAALAACSAVGSFPSAAGSSAPFGSCHCSCRAVPSCPAASAVALFPHGEIQGCCGDRLLPNLAGWLDLGLER